MSIVSEVSSKFKELVGSMGRPALGALYPNDFEVYMMTLEVVDSLEETQAYLSFPILPSEVVKTESELTNIKRTAGGIVALTTNVFTQQEITISGNFGRSFKILIGQEDLSLRALGDILKKGLKQGFGSIGSKSVFNKSIKTGFGCTKLLQSIITLSTQLDSRGKPYRLYLYNPTLGENYLVEKSSATFRQDKESSNAMWEYLVSFKILAPAEDIPFSKQTKSLSKTLVKGIQQNTLNILASKTLNIVAPTKEKLDLISGGLQINPKDILSLIK